MRWTGGVDFTVHEVARMAQTSLRAFYEHFANKDELLVAVCTAAIAEIADRLAEAVAEHDDPADQLRAYIETLFHATFDEEHPEMAAMIAFHLHLVKAAPAALDAILEPRMRILVDVVERGVRTGRFRTGLPPETAAAMISDLLVHTLVTNAFGGGEPRGAEVVEFCLSAVGTVRRRARGRAT